MFFNKKTAKIDESTPKGLWDGFFQASLKQEWDRGLELLDKLKALTPDDPQVELKRGDLLQRKGKKQEALASYHKAAAALVGSGEQTKAIAIYKIIMRLDPADPDAAKGLAAIAEQLERSAAAALPDAGEIQLASFDGEISVNEPEEAVEDTPAEPQAAYQPESPSAEEPPSEPEETPEPGGISEEPSENETNLDWSAAASTEESAAQWDEPAAADATAGGDLFSAGQPTAPPEDFSFESAEPPVAEAQDGMGAEWGETPTKPVDEESLWGTESPGAETAGAETLGAETLEAPEEDIAGAGTVPLAPELETFDQVTMESPETLGSETLETPDAGLEDSIMALYAATGDESAGGEDEAPSDSFFSLMNEDDRKELMDTAEHRTYSDGEAVLEEDDTRDSIFYIKEGSADVKTNLLGKTLHLATLGKGVFFGEVAFLTGQPRTASVYAKGRTEVMEISKSLMQRMIDQNPLVLDVLVEFYHSRAQATVAKIKGK